MGPGDLSRIDEEFTSSRRHAVPAGHRRGRQDHEHYEHRLDEADAREAACGASVGHAPASHRAAPRRRINVERRLERATTGPDGADSDTEREQMECGEQPWIVIVSMNSSRNWLPASPLRRLPATPRRSKLTP
jgi:hypothetical protein